MIYLPGLHLAKVMAPTFNEEIEQYFTQSEYYLPISVYTYVSLIKGSWKNFNPKSIITNLQQYRTERQRKKNLFMLYAIQ